MALDRVVQFILRGAQLVFAAIVAGITGAYLHASHASDWDNGRFIYTIVVASLSLLFALIWLFPFSGSFIHWPTDIFLSILWFVAFGLLVNLIGDGCGPIFNWSNVNPRGDACGRNKANIAFCFLSAIVWLAAALVGLFWVRRHTAVADNRPVHHGRRRWYRSSRV
ncbi:membrane-associating domain-containing protein [Colletotrichum navitas]|uniref:Membrane-associating domain-containing protein n=1 Tax=Colletotrichum navitas TaxID=681940 RepID=A0AAD8PNE8_9PEZI|nr:membrane-associating domain-containing protein [Colletotrichum navitas]KAK1572751.1 membrane-associating domain-containing protein [Colletotrichum navitas]